MIKNGQGIIAIPIDEIGNYFTKLIEYYETGNNEEIKQWIYDTSVDGIE